MTYTAEQHAENRAKWVAALRSGEFLQAQDALRNEVWDEDVVVGVGYCCLGVLCEVFQRETGKGHWDEGSARENDEFIVDDELDPGNDTSITPPQDVAEWVGLTNRRATYGVAEPTGLRGNQTSLAKHNDSGDYDFEGIADVIESRPAGLFVD